MNEKQRFGEILVRAGVLQREALDTVLARVGDQRVDLGETLVSRGLIDEGTMLQAVGKALNLPSVGLDQAEPDEQALALVPRALCEQFFLIPIEVERSRTGEHLHVAMANPTDVQAIKQVTRRARRRIRPLLAPARSIRAAIERFYGPESISISTSGERLDEGHGSSASMPSRRDPSADGALERTPLPETRPRRAPESLDLGSALIPPDRLSREPSPPERPLLGGDRPLLGGDRPATPSPERPVLAPELSMLAPERSAAPDRPAAREPARATMGLRRSHDDDLFEALDHAAQENVAGPADLALNARGRNSEFGVVRRSRRPRSRGQVDTGNLPPSAPGLPGPGPLPALPPGLGSRRRRPERTTNRPEPRRRPGTSPPPADMPTSRHAGEMLDLETPMPEGIVDDRVTDDRVDVRRLLERIVGDTHEGESGADHVVSDYLERYGSGIRGTGDRTFAALDHALSGADSGTAKLLVALIRHLARRGLVDLDELIASLAK